MHRTRHVIVMTLVATALCADRAASAAPVLSKPVSSAVNPLARLATKLAGRLSGNFRPAISVARSRPTGQSSSIVPPLSEPQLVYRPSPLGSPLQFPLPPPTLA
jgi:hypothetical protein